MQQAHSARGSTPVASAQPSSSAKIHGMTGRVTSAYASASASCSSTDRAAGTRQPDVSHARSIVAAHASPIWAPTSA
jgi:hypothetical protein